MLKLRFVLVAALVIGNPVHAQTDSVPPLCRYLMAKEPIQFADAYCAFSEGDHVTAFRIWRLLADDGDAKAQTWVGRMYENGEGVTQNYAEAARWYRRAANQGNTDSQLHLASLYEGRPGFPMNLVEAHKWLNISSTLRNNNFVREYRDKLALSMNNKEVADAQRLASEWKAKSEK